MKNRGEIWIVDLTQHPGDEIKKKRPALIVNDDEVGALNLRIIVPFTHWQTEFDSKSWLIDIIPDKSNNLHSKSAADVFQVKSLDADLIVHGPIGKLEESDMKRIEFGLLKALGIIKTN